MRLPRRINPCPRSLLRSLQRFKGSDAVAEITGSTCRSIPRIDTPSHRFKRVQLIFLSIYKFQTNPSSIIKYRNNLDIDKRKVKTKRSRPYRPFAIFLKLNFVSIVLSALKWLERREKSIHAAPLRSRHPPR